LPADTGLRAAANPITDTQASPWLQHGAVCAAVTVAVCGDGLSTQRVVVGCVLRCAVCVCAVPATRHVACRKPHTTISHASAHKSLRLLSATTYATVVAAVSGGKPPTYVDGMNRATHASRVQGGGGFVAAVAKQAETTD
jgi:hypothetical protein